MNATDLMKQAGITGSLTALQALVPAFMSWTPAVSDPHNLATQRLVAGLQALVNKKGYGPLAIDGIIGKKTHIAMFAALETTEWIHLPWTSLYSRMLSVKQQVAPKAPKAPDVAFDTTEQSSFSTGNAGLVKMGALAFGAAWMLGFFKKGKRR